jgi:hypothetical protein
MTELKQIAHSNPKTKMKFLVLFSLMAACLMAACNNNGSAQTESSAADSNTETATTTAATRADAQGSVDAVVQSYLALKNALASDNGKEAAAAAGNVSAVLNSVDVKTLPPAQQGIYTDVAEDMKEHAQHIADNAGKMDHQREHFETLSKDLYDLVKAGSVKQTLYKDFCPMYNNNKGGMWLSETKEIKNPYMGQKMAACGEIQEELGGK